MTQNGSDSDLITKVFPIVLKEKEGTFLLFTAEARSTDSLQVAIEAVINDKATSDAEKDKLSIISRLYTTIGPAGIVAAFHEITSGQPTLFIESPQRLVELLSSVKPDPLPAATAALWPTVRCQLFIRTPTSALVGLISNAIITEPQALSGKVAAFLRLASEQLSFNISKQPVKDTFDAKVKNEQGETKPIMEVAGVTSDHVNELKAFLVQLQELQTLVTQPEDIGIVANCTYASPEDVAKDRLQAVEKLTKAGIPADRAEKIVARAVMIDLTRERIWADALKARGTSGIADVIIAAADTNSKSKSASAQSSGSPPKEINLSTMFDLESMGCVECASVFSPAAYFVHLLEELDKIKGADSKSLKEKLLSRRGDLETLELSCSNTKIPIPYVDLVNEVLESALAKAGSLPTIIGNMGDEDENNDVYLLQPQNTNYAVYQKIVGEMVFPMNVYPFNQAMHSTRAFLEAIGVSRYQLLDTFTSVQRIVQSPLGVTDASTISLHARSAEALGLQHEDYLAITKESYYSYHQLQLIDTKVTVDEYGVRLGLKKGYEYWGYASDTEMTGPQGLTDIKNQFLPRSGLEFSGLITLLKTEFIGKRLVLLSQDRKTMFDGTLEQMRLWQIPLKDKDAKENIIEPSLCDEIQRFLRLKNKLGWAIEELDALYFTLVGALKSESFSADFLDHLAAVKQLASLTSIPPSDLQPLWGDMYSHNETSLYFKLFCKSYLGASNDAFLPEEIAKETGKLSDQLQVILRVLRITAEEYEAIRSASKMEDKLSISNLSQLYRTSLLCKILSISPLQYVNLVSLFEHGFDPFMNPATTLSVVERLQSSSDSPLPLELPELAFAVRGVPNSSDDNTNITLDKNIEITTTLLSKLGSVSSEEQSADGDLLLKTSQLCNRVLGADKGQKIVDFLRDPASSPVPKSPEDHFLVQYLSPFLGQDGALNLLKALTSQSSEEGDAAVLKRCEIFLNTMTPIVTRAQDEDFIVASLRTFFTTLDAASMRLLLSEIIKYAEVSSGSATISSGMDALLQMKNAAATGTTTYDGYFRPPTTDTYIFTDVVEAGHDLPTLKIDGSQLTFSTPSSNQRKAISNRLLGGQWLRFQYSGDISRLTWTAQTSVGTAAAKFTGDLLVNERLVSKTEAIVTKLARLSFIMTKFNLQDTEIEFWNNTGRFNFNSLSLDGVEELGKYQIIRNECNRRLPEQPLIELYRWLFSPPHDAEETLSTRLTRVTGWPQPVISSFLEAKYPKLDESARREEFKNISTLFEVLEVMRFTSKINLASLSLEALFNAAQPGIPVSNGSIVTKDFEVAAILRSAMQSIISSSSLRNGATPLSAANDVIRAAQRNALVQCLLSPKYRVHEYATTPDKLFGYFLCDVEMGPELQTSRIVQANSTIQLFIQRCMLGAEVTYGGVDDKARIQLMAQDLDSMLRYRLWEAKQRAFFYPENWLEPTLRDDKTEQYLALESAVMETKLDTDTIASLFKGYMYRVNEVADLQVDAYLWERKDKRVVVTDEEEGSPDLKDISYESEIYVFARTRTIPATYYHRKLQLGGSEVNIVAYWSPWTKMNVDVPVQDLDGAGNKMAKTGSYLIPAVFNNRVYVFLPEILSRKKDLKLEEGGGEDTDDPTIKYLEKTVPRSNSQRRWEVRLGYIEFQNNKWTNKKVSQSSLYIIEEKSLLPDVSNFQFQVETRDPDGILRVKVGRVVGAAMKMLGQFEMRGEQLVLVDDGSYPVSSTEAPTFVGSTSTYQVEFSKLVSRTGDNWGDRTKDGVFASKIPQPILPIKKKRKGKAMSHSLVMSFDHINYGAPTGFIMESSDSDKAQTFFAFPPDYGKFKLEPDDEESGKLDGMRVKFENLSDYINPMLLKDMNKDRGLKTLFSTLRAFKYSTDNKPVEGDYSQDIFGRRNSALPHELSTPFAIYNWELGVHIPSLLIERLLATQQFELALSVARLVFDPTIVGGNVEEAWSFPPFRDEQVRTGKGPTFDLDWKKRMTQDEWLESKGNVHAAARGKPSAYMIRIAMKYIEILIAAGDYYFRQDTLENIPLALQRYTEASQVFGPQPTVIPRLGKPAVMTYKQLKGHLDPNSNVKIDVGLEFPFFGIPGPDDMRSEINDRYLGFMRTDYFCVPANPALVALRNLIDDRLYNIRHGLDINGRKRTLALFEPPIDPGAVQRAMAGVGGSSLGSLLADVDSPMPKYRFNYLIQRAYEFASELKSTEQLLVSIKERKDAESLSMLRYKHQRSISALTMKIKEYQKTEVQKSRDTLEEARRQQEMSLQYYLQLAGESKAVPKMGESWEDIPISIEAPTKDDLRMSPYENMEGEAYDKASTLNTVAAGLETQAAALLALPQITMSVEPWGVGVSTTVGGNTIGQAAQSVALAMRAAAQSVTDQGARAGRKSALSRQLQERLLQANIIGHEIVKIDKDIAQLDSRLATVEAEIKLQQQEIDNAQAEEEWVRKKYTNEQLYNYLDNAISQTFHQTYLMTLDIAKAVRRALDFEHAVRYPDSSTSISQQPLTIGGYWQNSVDGLTCGEALTIDLRKMEMMHMENATHDYEIVKAVSLRQLDPLSLIQLQETGSANIDLSEALFDRDFPGHYCRRLASVALSFPCIIGPYTSINCTLSLNKHRYRTSPLAKDAKTLYDDEDGKYRTDRIPITSVAISGGSQDTGTFSLDFQGSGQYGPFEGAGAISEWHVELPDKQRQFDYRTISDVVMHLKYTSVNSSGRLKEFAQKAIESVKAAPLAINLKENYPAGWRGVSNSHNTTPPVTMTLEGLRDRFPFWTREKAITPTKVKFLVYPEVQTMKVKETGSQTPISLTRDDGAKLGAYTAWTLTENIPSLSKSWDVEFGIAALERGWLVIEY